VRGRGDCLGFRIWRGVDRNLVYDDAGRGKAGGGKGEFVGLFAWEKVIQIIMKTCGCK